MTSPAPGGPVTAFVGDSHLLPDELHTEAFIAFVGAAPERFERLVLVGDIFDLWIARPHLHEEHHVRVLDALEGARRRGLAIDYAVGNRDFAVETWPCAPFDRVASELLAGPPVGGRPAWLAEHGDLVNERDRQYRAWRTLSRSVPVLGLFLALPGRWGRPLSLWLEQRMRTTNLAYKREFPLDAARRRASSWFRRTGARYLVLGHFHEERRFEAGEGEVLVLPDWKRSRRHAEWSPGHDGRGQMAFEDSLVAP